MDAPAQRGGSAAVALAEWATAFHPGADDLELAQRSLRDTAAVIAAAREHPLRPVLERLTPAGRLAALAHVHDYDDLHLPSTTHISAVCVPAALAGAGADPAGAGADPARAGADPIRPDGARAYLAGAGAMARLGAALGWRHYSSGWHATCTAGAPAAAVAAAVARGLGAEATARAIALALPAAGGVQRAFGTAGKSLQVGFAAEAGVRAAALAQAGASADPRALEQWMELVGGDAAALLRALVPGGEVIPGGLAIKVYPCCYALQRPIAAIVELLPLDAARVRAVRITTPRDSLQPLIHSRPGTGLEGKFSLEYAVAATLLDGRPTLASFTDAAVARPEARRLVERVEVVAGGEEAGAPAASGLLDGELSVEIELAGGETVASRVKLPPGAPGRPLGEEDLRAKLQGCAGSPAEASRVAELTWETVAVSEL